MDLPWPITTWSTTTWYAAATIGFVTVIIIYFIAYSFTCFLASHLVHIALKQVVYSSLSCGNIIGVQLLRCEFLLAVLYTSANAICMAFRASSATDWSARAASLLATNLVLLMPGVDIAADTLRVSLRSYQKAHEVIGGIALVEGIIHISITVATKTGKGNNTHYLSGIVAAASLGIICLTSLPMFRNRSYELFRALHFLLSISIGASLWFHVSATQQVAKVQVAIGSIVWIASFTHRIWLLVYRNFSWSGPRTKVTIENVFDALIVEVILARSWKVRPGQYVYLTMTKVGLFSLLQRHPFMVTELPGENCIELRIQPRDGFTRRLLEKTRTRAYSGTAFIEGPYGLPHDLDTFGTVVMFASGIGITGHLSYIREILRSHQQLSTKTRDALLIWHVESEKQQDLVASFMDGVLRKDRYGVLQKDGNGHEVNKNGHRIDQNDGKAERKIGSSDTVDRPGLRPTPSGENILDIYIYRNDLHEAQQRIGRRIAEIRGKPDVSQILHDVLGTRKGRIAVSVCASQDMKNQARAMVANFMDKDVRFIELDFQPHTMVENVLTL